MALHSQSLPGSEPASASRHVPGSARRRLRLRVARGGGLLVLGLVVGAVPGCATLSSLTALSHVRFDLDRVSEVRLSGVNVLGVRSSNDLRPADALRIAAAIAQGSLPLEMTLLVSAENPDTNPEARLLELNWDLFLEGRRAVGGGIPAAVVLPSGVRTGIPVTARLDLLEFMDGSARDIVNLALGLVGAGGEPVAVRLEAVPTVETPLGPIRYPRPLVLGSGGTP
jgi:hypothetical protein